MKMKRENRGLTLVELMITIAILAIVIAAATSFMITGSRSFTKGSADSDLQKEAELTVNQIEDMVIDVNGGLSWDDSATDADGNKTETKLLMYFATQEPDESGTLETKYYGEAVVWKKSDDSGEMYYSKWDVNYDSTNGFVPKEPPTDDYQLLAERVSLFEVDLDTVDETATDGTVYQVVRGVQIRVGYENSFGDVEYATSPIITLRNRMLLSDNPDEIFEVPATVSADMKLYYSGPEFVGTVPIMDMVSEVYCGSEYQIYAWLIGGTNVSHLVNWELETPNCSSSIDASSGLLHVADNESNESLTIVARYKTNPNKYARGVVKVVSATKSFRAITITRDSLTPFSPSFDSYPTLQGDWSTDEINAIQYTWSVSAPERLENYNGIDKNKKTFGFNVKKESSNFGQVFDITLTAYAPATGETRSDRIQYRVDDNATDEGDSFMKRGMMEHGEIQFWFDTVEFDYDVIALSWEYYFCDIYGDRISAYDDLLSHVWLGGNIGDNYGNHHFNYTLAYDEGLPLNREYYVKVVTHMKDPRTGTEWDHERIFYIPAVQLFDSHYYGINDAGWFWCYFDMVGYWNVALQNPENVGDIIGFDQPEVDYSVEETRDQWNTDPDNPVTVSVEMGNPVARADTGPNGMRFDGHIVHNCKYWQKLTIHSIKFRVYMKQYPDVYTYINMYFD